MSNEFLTEDTDTANEEYGQENLSQDSQKLDTALEKEPGSLNFADFADQKGMIQFQEYSCENVGRSSS